MTCEELGRLVRAKAPVLLLDVREPFERNLARIPAEPNAVDLFVPMRQVPRELAKIRAAVASAQAPLVVYCHHGVRSQMVGQWLAAQGIDNVFNLDGGIDAYSQEVDPSVPRY